MKKQLMIIFAVLLLCAVGRTVKAEEMLGSISVEMTFEGNVVSGGSLTILNTNKINTDSLEIEKLLSAAKEQGIEGQTQTVAADGMVIFDNLPEGTYLIYQRTSASGYSKIAPFLITLPAKIGNEIYYHVDASPKVELDKLPQPDSPEKPSVPKGDKLPQTGQLNWPIPVLSVTGLLLFAIGWYLCFIEKGEYHER